MTLRPGHATKSQWHCCEPAVLFFFSSQRPPSRPTCSSLSLALEKEHTVMGRALVKSEYMEWMIGVLQSSSASSFSAASCTGVGFDSISSWVQKNLYNLCISYYKYKCLHMYPPTARTMRRPITVRYVLLMRVQAAARRMCE